MPFPESSRSTDMNWDGGNWNGDDYGDEQNHFPRVAFSIASTDFESTSPDVVILNFNRNAAMRPAKGGTQWTRSGRWHPKTYQETADHMTSIGDPMTAEDVRRIEKQALFKLGLLASVVDIARQFGLKSLTPDERNACDDTGMPGSPDGCGMPETPDTGCSTPVTPRRVPLWKLRRRPHCAAPLR